MLTFLYVAPVGLLQTNLAGQVDLINASATMMLMPLSLQYACGMDNLFDLLKPLAPDLPDRIAAMGHQNGTVCDDLRLQLTQPGGPPAHGALRMIKLDQHRLVTAITDITQQVLAEQGRRQAEERLRFALAAAQIGDSTAESTEGSDTSTDWHLQTLLNRVHPDDRATVQQGLESAVRDASAWRTEFRVQWSDASVHWLTLQGCPVPKPGDPDKVAHVAHGSSLGQQAEEMRRRTLELEADNQRLQEASRLKSQFLATMSHELRSPLTSIIGFTDLLRNGVGAAGSTKHGECLDRIARNGQHLRRLINDVLDLSKVEAGKFEFRPDHFDLAVLAVDVRDTMASQWQAKQLTIHLDIADDLNDLCLDASRLRQVLYNLISNAIKFTPLGGQITLSARSLDTERFQLTVKDTGMGIAPANLPRLFKEFQQLDADPSRNPEGTGLGLALTQALVLAQGGEISVDSTLGVGTTFKVTLPRVHRPDAVVASTEPARHRSP